MIATDERLGRAQPKEELTRRAKQGFPVDPRDAATTPGTRRLPCDLDAAPRGPADDAGQMPSAGSPTVLEPRGGDDADMNDADDGGEDYAGVHGMSAATDDEAADRCPVPESDSDSDEDSDENMMTPQAAGAPQAARDDAGPGLQGASSRR